MHLSEQVGTYYVMQHKATLLSFVPTDILWEAIRDYRMDQEAKQKNETNGFKGEKRSNGVVASAGDDWDAKRQRTGTDAEDAEAVGGEVRMTGDEKAVDGEDAEAVADAVAVDGEGRENSCGLLDLGIEAAIAECKIGMQSSTSAGSFLQDAPQFRSLGPLALPLIGIVLILGSTSLLLYLIYGYCSLRLNQAISQLAKELFATIAQLHVPRRARLASSSAVFTLDVSCVHPKTIQILS